MICVYLFEVLEIYWSRVKLIISVHIGAMNLQRYADCCSYQSSFISARRSNDIVGTTSLYYWLTEVGNYGSHLVFGAAPEHSPG